MDSCKDECILHPIYCLLLYDIPHRILHRRRDDPRVAVAGGLGESEALANAFGQRMAYGDGI